MRTANHASHARHRASRAARRQYLEALEPRTLLSAAFSPADAAGTWALIGINSAGSVVVDSAGNIVGGSFRNRDDNIFDFTGGSGTMASSDSGAITLSVDATGGISFDLTGAMNGSKQIITAVNDLDTITLIKHTLGTFSNADFAGTWNLTTIEAHGSIIADGNGHITGGSVISSDGYNTVFLAGSHYSVSPDGTVSVTVVVNGDTAPQTFTFDGAISNSKDTIGLSCQSFVDAYGPDGGGPAALFLQKRTGAYSNADLVGAWSISGYEDGDPFGRGFNDHFTFDGAGRIIADASSLDPSDDGREVTGGTYTVSSAGQFTATVNVLSFNTSTTYVHKYAGWLTPGASFLALQGTVTSPTAPGWSNDELLLITDDNAMLTFTTTTTLGTAVVGLPYTFTYSDLLAHSNAKDRDGFPLTFQVASIVSGQLAINGDDASYSDTDHNFGTINPGDTVTWTPSSTTGPTTALTLNVTDGLLESAAFVPLKITVAAKPTVTVTATKPIASETNPAFAASAGTFTFTRVGGDLSSSLDVAFDITGSATSGTDYADLPAFVTFAPNKTTATLTLTPINDTKADAGHNVILTLEPDTAYNLGLPAKRSATVTITDNEPTLSIMAVKPTATETNPGLIASAGTITFTRTGGNLAASLTVDFTTTGSAIADTDYIGLPDSITFDPLQLTKTISVTPINDTKADAGHNVIVTLDTDTLYNVNQLKKTATVTITDNEPVVSVAATKPLASETNPNLAASAGTYTFTRTGGNLASSLTVNFTISGSAIAATDYVALPDFITFDANQLTKTLTLTPLNDSKADVGHNVILTLDTDTLYNVNQLKKTATVTIADNEATVSVAATKPLASETNPNLAASAGTFTFTRTGGNLASSLTVNFTISGSAIAATDYVALPDFITFDANQLTKTLTLTPLNDAIADAGHNVVLTLDTDTLYNVNQLKKTATVTITDNEPVVTVMATKPAASETNPNLAASAGTFTFTRAGGNLAASLTVHFTTAGSAIADTDYVALPASITFDPNQLTKTLTLTPKDDPKSDPGHIVILTLTADADYNLGLPAKRAATVTITDNEPVVTLTRLKNASEKLPFALGEGQITVRRTGGSLASDLLVHYTVTGNAGGHFVPLSGTVTIPAALASTTIDINPIIDGTIDGTMNVIVTLDASDPAFGYSPSPLLLSRSATVTVADADAFVGARTITLVGNNNIRDGVNVESDTFIATTVRTDATHLNVTGNGVTFPMVQDGSFLRLATHPTVNPSFLTPNMFVASDGVNGAMLHMGQEAYDHNDVSIQVAAWTSATTATTAAALAGTWQATVYSDDDLLANPGAPFAKQTWTFTLADLGNNQVQMNILSGGEGSLTLQLSGNTLTVLAGDPGNTFQSFQARTDGTGLTFAWISSDNSNPTSVSAGIALARQVIVV